MRTLALRDHLRTEQLIHDIRSPLSAIRGYAQLLRYRLANDTASAADVEDGLRRIVESAKRVDDLLDLLPGSSTPWIRAGVKRESTELVQLARRVAADCEAAYGSRSPVVVLSDVAELVGWWNAVRLERMLANLISNALKSNRECRPVIVTLQRDGDSAVLRGPVRNKVSKSARSQRVIPLRMSGVGLECELSHDAVGDGDAGRVGVEIESGRDRQASCGARCSDEADDSVEIDQRTFPASGC